MVAEINQIYETVLNNIRENAIIYASLCFSVGAAVMGIYNLIPSRRERKGKSLDKKVEN